MPTIRKNMADINSSDQALNGLKIKTDALPNDWYVTLVNPKTGETAENMTIARFSELFLINNKIWTENNDGPESNLYAGIAKKLVSTEIVADDDLNDFKEEGWYFCPYSISTILNTPVNLAFSLIINRTTGNSGCVQRFYSFYPVNPRSFIRTYHDGTWSNWREYKYIDIASAKSNALTETIVEEVPVSADTPMTLQEDGQLVPTTHTVERYEYSVPKMAEAILALQKEIAELKGGAGKE